MWRGMTVKDAVALGGGGADAGGGGGPSPKTPRRDSWRKTMPSAGPQGSAPYAFLD